MKERNPHITAHPMYDQKRKARIKRWTLISLLLLILVIAAAVLNMNLVTIQQAPGPEWMNDNIDMFYNKVQGTSRFVS